ncbi:MAG: hypothetical protein LBW85_01570 [Deltaproteobacteria bacterium]|nr:hypothetical protein [Deltaproteobacteria bacterium]
MRNGCAGFFTAEALASGRGLPSGAPGGGKAAVEPGLAPADGKSSPSRLSPGDLDRIRSGDLSPLGPRFRDIYAEGAPPLPSGRLALIKSASAIERGGGAWGGGFIRCEAEADPQAWYLAPHFRGDEVMPGTLMYDASLQAMRLYLLTLGWLPGPDRVFLPTREVATALKCRGQVTPRTRQIAYDIHIRELSLQEPRRDKPKGRRPGRPAKPVPEPCATADCVMWADGRPIVEVTGLALTLSGGSLEQIAGPFREKRPKGRPPAGAAKAWATLAAAETPGEAPTAAAPEASAAASPGKPPAGAREPSAASGARLREAGAAARPDTPLGQGPAAGGKRPGPLSPRSRALYFYPADKVLRLSQGPVSAAFGPLFSRFDGGAFFPRLPQAPYDFMEEAEVTRGEVGKVIDGSELTARHRLDPSRWIFAEAGGPRILPYAAVNEIALQPCGFLASFMGSYLPFDGPMHFRNLGGEAVTLKPVTPAEAGLAETTARLDRHSVLGDTVIQHYSFRTLLDGEPLYEGITHFGFSSPENLARQEGLKFKRSDPILPRPPEDAFPEGYPRGPAWPRGHWRMVDRLLWKEPPEAGPPDAVWGLSRVNPGAWFFAAHFPHDPVWPGSLGLEAFFQAGKALALRRFFPGEDISATAAAFSGPVPGRPHKWLYRGQIVPVSRQCVIGLQATAADEAQKILTFRGVLWVDDLPIYRVDDFTVQVHGL